MGRTVTKMPTAREIELLNIIEKQRIDYETLRLKLAKVEQDRDSREGEAALYFAEAPAAKETCGACDGEGMLATYPPGERKCEDCRHGERCPAHMATMKKCVPCNGTGHAPGGGT